MARRRQVRRSADFVVEAERLFPRGGSAEGRPSFEVFEAGPLRGAETAFAMGSDVNESRSTVSGASATSS
jgi:hypothetical protein